MAEKIKTDELVKKLLVDGKKPEDTIMVYGFVGEGSQEDTTILYLDPVLQTSVELKDEDILHSVNITRTHSALGGTLLWIKNASSYLYKNKAKSQEDANRFFEGDIYQQYATQNPTAQKGQCAPGACGCK